MTPKQQAIKTRRGKKWFLAASGAESQQRRRAKHCECCGGKKPSISWALFLDGDLENEHILALAATVFLSQCVFGGQMEPRLA